MGFLKRRGGKVIEKVPAKLGLRVPLPDASRGAMWESPGREPHLWESAFRTPLKTSPRKSLK